MTYIMLSEISYLGSDVAELKPIEKKVIRDRLSERRLEWRKIESKVMKRRVKNTKREKNTCK